MKFHCSVLIISLTAILVMVLAACANAPETEMVKATDTPNPKPINTNTPTPTITPSPTPTLPYIVRTASQSKSLDPATYIHAGPSLYTFDPALYYSGLIHNVYETLVLYDKEKVDSYIPGLAESWEVTPDGKTWTFKIRQGVKFHNEDELAASDIAFSFQRALLHGGDDFQYLFSEPFFGFGVTDVAWLVDSTGELVNDTEGIKRADPNILVSVCEQIKSMIMANDTNSTVTMQLAQSWSPFLATLAFPSLSIMDAKWVAEKGGWDGTCETWQNFYGMEVLEGSPFDQTANGTGPFKLTYWKLWDEVVLVRNDDYWRDPAKLARVNVKMDWSGEKFLKMMDTGTADSVYDRPEYHDQMDELVGERCEYDRNNNVYKPCEVVDDTKPLVAFSGKPEYYQQFMLFNFDIPGSYGNHIQVPQN